MTDDVREKWVKFKDLGLLWLINCLLHNMGYAIVFMYDNDNRLLNVVPMRVGFRGFTEELEREGQLNLSEHLEHMGSVAKRKTDI